MALLAEERSVTLSRLSTLRAEFERMVAASVDSNADDEHDPEGSTIAFERSQLAALIEQARRHVRETDEARERLVSGRYGVCESCGDRIARPRLEARPVARTCVSCASARPR